MLFLCTLPSVKRNIHIFTAFYFFFTASAHHDRYGINPCVAFSGKGKGGAAISSQHSPSASLSGLVLLAGEAVWSISEDRLDCRLDIDSTAEWELGIQYLGFYIQAYSHNPKPIITELYDVYENIFSSSGHTDLPMFKDNFLVREAEVTALEQFVRPGSDFGQF